MVHYILYRSQTNKAPPESGALFFDCDYNFAISARIPARVSLYGTVEMVATEKGVLLRNPAYRLIKIEK